MSLFRKEVIAQQSERVSGAITLAQPQSIKLLVLFISLLAFAINVSHSVAEYSSINSVRCLKVF